MNRQLPVAHFTPLSSIPFLKFQSTAFISRKKKRKSNAFIFPMEVFILKALIERESPSSLTSEKLRSQSVGVKSLSQALSVLSSFKVASFLPHSSVFLSFSSLCLFCFETMTECSEGASVTLDRLKEKMAEFARERNWDQFHSPRNLLLALVREPFPNP